jgi:branched-chain amino acid aminotransferase
VQIVAVTRVDHRPVGDGRIGPIASALRKLYFDVVRGRRPDYRHWCAPVYGSAAALQETRAREHAARPAVAGS